MHSLATSTQYAIVDIETTGGYAAGSGITEIAILIHDGHRVVEQFESLINPLCPIPLAIQAMTGITDDMVVDSPTFDKLATRLFELLHGRIFVAHNVNFDYSFLRHHFELAGFRFTVPKICTVRMSRKIRPGLPSYSLGKLCNTLGIPIHNRHRAGGDAQATALLFTKLLEWDSGDVIAEMLKKTTKHQQLPPHLPKERFDRLPYATGVYYFHDKQGKVIYVGKAQHIRNRVAQHFSGHNPNPQRQHFLRHIHDITFECCGTELMALLLEAAEIQRLWPAYNRAMKRFEPKYALYTYEDQNGYLRLAVGKHLRHHQTVHVFHRQLDAINLLNRLIREFNLSRTYCIFGLPTRVAPLVSQKLHTAGTTSEINAADHNRRVQMALDHLEQHLPTFAIMDRGLESNESSCIWVENGHFYGMGYISRHAAIQQPEAVKASLKRYQSNHYITQLIYHYAEKYPAKVWKPGSI